MEDILYNNDPDQSPIDSVSIEEREFVFLLISLYRDCPELWKVKSKEYLNKNKRSLAIQKILNVLKMYKPHYTEEIFKKKINSLRSNFNRECQKIDQKKKSGASTDEVLEPTLWYYNELSFIKDQVEIADTESSEKILNEEDASSPADTVTPVPTPSKKRKNSLSSNSDELIDLACKYFKRPETESEILAKGWAMKLDKLKPDQKLFAEKIINETIFEAEMGTLTRKGVKFLTNSPSNSISIPAVPHDTHINTTSDFPSAGTTPELHKSEIGKINLRQPDYKFHEPTDNLSKTNLSKITAPLLIGKINVRQPGYKLNVIPDNSSKHCTSKFRIAGLKSSKIKNLNLRQSDHDLQPDNTSTNINTKSDFPSACPTPELHTSDIGKINFRQPSYKLNVISDNSSENCTSQFRIAGLQSSKIKNLNLRQPDHELQPDNTSTNINTYSDFPSACPTPELHTSDIGKINLRQPGYKLNVIPDNSSKHCTSKFRIAGQKSSKIKNLNLRQPDHELQPDNTSTNINTNSDFPSACPTPELHTSDIGKINHRQPGYQLNMIPDNTSKNRTSQCRTAGLQTSAMRNFDFRRPDHELQPDISSTIINTTGDFSSACTSPELHTSVIGKINLRQPDYKFNVIPDNSPTNNKSDNEDFCEARTAAELLSNYTSF